MTGVVWAWYSRVRPIRTVRLSTLGLNADCRSRRQCARHSVIHPPCFVVILTAGKLPVNNAIGLCRGDIVEPNSLIVFDLIL
jgi:hypothetical protein